MQDFNNWNNAMGWAKKLETVTSWKAIARAYSPLSVQCWIDRLTQLYPQYEYRVAVYGQELILEASRLTKA